MHQRRRTHNPKVAGSNPAPATIEHGDAPDQQVRGLFAFRARS
jgi:hypothetical protein